MKNLRFVIVLAGVFALGVHGAAPSASTLPEIQLRSQDQLRSQLSDRQVQVILTRIRTNAESLLRAIEGAPPRGRALGNRARQTGDVAWLIDDLVQASVHLSDHVTRRETTRTDVDDLLSRAHMVDRALARNPGSTAAQTAWTNIRRDIDRVASAYSVAWDWQNPEYPGIPGTGVYQRLTGTYELDAIRSDDPQRVLDAALRGVSAANRPRVRRQLIDRLDTPDLLSIDRIDQRVIVASSLGPQVSFEADGQARTTQDASGRTMTTRAILYGDQLEITSTGAADVDFAVTFEPLAGGQDLRVTHRVYNDALSQPVTLQTVYRRTSATPDWRVHERVPVTATEPSVMLVPDGLALVARLEQTVNLRTARDDDPITLVVRNAPRAEFEGATIEGYLRTTSDSTNLNRGVVVRFDQIRLRNGRTSEFDGVIERMVGPNGETVRFDGEQTTAADRDQTREAIERGAIGAAIGALMGAIVGGSRGAAIGAVVGGGGAAATVLIDDAGQTQLVRGTEFTIRSRAR